MRSKFFYSDLFQCFWISLALMFNVWVFKLKRFKVNCVRLESLHAAFHFKAKVSDSWMLPQFYVRNERFNKNEIWMRENGDGRWTECTRLMNKFIPFWKRSTWRSGKMFAGGNLLPEMGFEMKNVINRRYKLQWNDDWDFWQIFQEFTTISWHDEQKSCVAYKRDHIRFYFLTKNTPKSLWKRSE